MDDLGQFNFQKAVCRHLSDYRDRIGELRVLEEGKFKHRGRSIPMAHIVPKEYWSLNILEQYRKVFFASKYSKIHYHRYFHHLNSSQAMSINLFYPLMSAKNMDVLIRFLQIPAIDGPEGCFELESKLERAGRKTNFDFHLSGSGVKEVFFEVKYTEREFGKAKNDEDHLRKFQETYLPLLGECDFLDTRCREEKVFLEHYQILRNLVHLNPNSWVVFLFPSANTIIKQEAQDACRQFLTEAGRARVRIAYLEDQISYLEANCSATLAKYYGEFRVKYLPTWMSSPEANPHGQTS